MSRGVVLLVSSDAAVSQAFRVAAAREGQLLVIEAAGEEGLAVARQECPDLIAIGPTATTEETLDLIRRFRSTELPPCALIAIAGAADERWIEAAAEVGADDLLVPPLEVADLRAELRWVERMRDLEERWSRDAERLAALEAEDAAWFDQVMALLESLIATAVPGCRERAVRFASLAGRLALRFDVPEPMRHELELAARLLELGRLASPRDAATHREPGAWLEARSTGEVLAHVERLREPGDLIASVYENWDGTGQPGHRLQGQIPLRSRILRVLRDYVAAADREGVERALERLAEKSGTLYDPMVVSQLAALLEGEECGDPRGSTLFVPVTALEVGMVLAEDLYSSSGIKLLARDTSLTRAALEAIQRRHRAEPILHSAAVRRAA